MRCPILIMKSKKISVALIGLGPHAKRIYINYFKKHNINLSLVVGSSVCLNKTFFIFSLLVKSKGRVSEILILGFLLLRIN